MSCAPSSVRPARRRSLVTHDQAEAMALSDRIVVMNHGRAEQVASPQDVYAKPETPFVAQFLGSTSPAKPSAPTPATTARFDTEAAAKAHCPGATVVWVNLTSDIYHFSGHPDYGRTKSGTYMCEKDAEAGGAHAAKNEKHP